MNTKKDAPAVEKTSVPSRRRLNRLSNLALQGTVELAGPDVNTRPMSDHFVVFSEDGAQLRQNGSREATLLNDAALARLAQEHGTITLDLVFAEDSCIDLSFSLPDALLPEMRRIIENEIAYRAPFAEDACFSFWIAEEQKDGTWRARAAVMLKEPVVSVLDQLAKHGLSAGVVRRATKGAPYAATPDWAGYSDSQRPSYGTKHLPAPLKMGLLGSAVFFVAAAALLVSVKLSAGQLRDEADAARALLTAQAQGMAEVRGLDTSLAQATDKLAMAGTLSALLPDGVWLDQLIVSDETVTLVGFAPSAADITGVLASLPQLSEIRFGSPVTRDNSQGLERFRIVADLTGAAG
ncbi:fimbrial assembly protein PilN [Yoonia maricola]|uniref:Fimbrial assembly protein PilN n=1 Tax=Yoonia maricola TaxID=420999 RepID=A0A2M8W1Y5_9RHOB|nr:PilN domain-containing protein [Yoonia maricola]PJI84918.1 fimbrial assembly protein PilN [Yoonia maricola]